MARNDNALIPASGEAPVGALDLNRLPDGLRKAAAMRKYAEAVALYASTSLPVREVAEACGVSPRGLSAHIGRHHRGLLLRRHGLDAGEGQPGARVKAPRGQSAKTRLKYRDAIEACGDAAYIGYNVSQVARMFGLSPSALAAQLKVHYPDVIPARERLRRRLGIADNAQRGPRPASAQAYARAIEMYRDTDMTIPEVALECGVPEGGLSQFLRFYRQDVIALKASRRQAATKSPRDRVAGRLAGNGSLYGPRPDTEEAYAEALELWRGTPLAVREIAERTGVPGPGLKSYLRRWHSARSRSSAAAKYAPAIASLRENPRPMARAAAEFGLNAEVFRQYLKAHEPGLAKELGMKRGKHGRLLRASSSEKYARAIREFASTAESLRSIAGRHGIAYKSISGYVKRNCPEALQSHKRIAEATASN